MYKTYKKINHILTICFLLFLNSCTSIDKKTLTLGEDNYENNDPYENTNRAIFDFNEDLDDIIFKPVARGWRKIPDFPRKNLTNLAETARAPLDIANSILQFDVESIRITVSRFLINMTFGVGGMYDVASSEAFGSIEKRHEDFGQTLATWGVKEGPYVMLPIFGPSNIRDAFGKGLDTIFNPLTFAYRVNNVGFEARLPQPVVTGASTRDKYMDYIDEIKKSSLDFYATMRSLYRQKRTKDISNGKKKTQNINYELPSYDDLYDDQFFENNEQITVDSLELKKDKNQINKDDSVDLDILVEDIDKLDPNMNSLPSSDYPEYNEENSNLLTN